MEDPTIVGSTYRFWAQLPTEDAFLSALSEFNAKTSVEGCAIVLVSPSKYVSNAGLTILKHLVNRGAVLRVSGDDSEWWEDSIPGKLVSAETIEMVTRYLAGWAKHFLGVGAGKTDVALSVDDMLGTLFAADLLATDNARNWEIKGGLECYQLVPGSGLVLRSMPEPPRDVVVLSEFMKMDVRWLGQDSFAESRIDTVHINRPVRAIGARAFLDSALQSVTLPESTVNIHEKAFAKTGLREVDLPEGLKFIGEGAFSGCKELAKVRIPSTVTSIGEGAFFDSAVSLELEVWRGSFAEGWAKRNGVKHSVVGTQARPYTEIKAGDFLYRRIGDHSLELVAIIDSSRGSLNLTVPSEVDGLTVTGIRADAFEAMTNLTSIHLPHNLMWIGPGAFASCLNLTRDGVSGIESVPFVAPNAFDESQFTGPSPQALEMRDARRVSVTPRMVLSHLGEPPEVLAGQVDLDVPFSRVTGIPDTSVEGTALFLGEEFWAELEKLSGDALWTDRPTQDPVAIIRDARKRGARLLVSSRSVDGIANDEMIVITHPNPAEAYEKIAAIVRRQYRLKTITLTGSIGKTTTKDMLALVAGRYFPTLASRGNMNSVGYVGPVMSGLTREHEIYIQETGASKFRAVEASVGIAQPNVFVATNIGRNHRLDYGDSQEALVNDKLSADRILPDDGLAFLNLDDPHLRQAALKHPVISFGVDSADVDYQAVEIQETIKRVDFTILDNRNGVRTPVQLNVVGWHNVYSALGTFAVSRWLGLEESSIADSLADFQPSQIRQNLVEIGRQLVLVDCFNANEVSAVGSAASLKHLPLAQGGRRIYVFGGLGDRGDDTESIHVELGRSLAELGVIDELVCFGEYAAHTAKGATEHGLVSRHFDERAELHQYLRDTIRTEDVVGFKATRKSYLEQAPDAIWGTTYAVSGANPKALRDVTEENSGVLRYKVLPARGALVTGVAGSASGTVRIPGEVGGEPVDAILRGSFEASDVRRIVVQPPLRALGRAAFLKCRKLLSVSLPSTLKIIGRSAFQDCSALRSLDIPDGTHSIERYAFLRCRNLQRVTIPATVLNIGDQAFARCPKLTVVCDEGSFVARHIQENYPDLFLEFSATTESQASEDANGLSNRAGDYDRSRFARDGAIFRRVSTTSVGLVSGPLDVANFAVPGGVDGLPVKRLLRGSFERAELESISISEPVTRIGRAAFLRNRKLRSVELPSSLRNLDRSAFRACSRLTRLELPEGVETIGDFAFSGCRSLRLLTIPDSVKHIGESAFRGCERLIVVCRTESYTASYIKENWPGIEIQSRVDF